MNFTKSKEFEFFKKKVTNLKMLINLKRLKINLRYPNIHRTDLFFLSLNKFTKLDQLDLDCDFYDSYPKLCHPNLKIIQISYSEGLEKSKSFGINCPRLECLCFENDFQMLDITYPQTIKHLGEVDYGLYFIISKYRKKNVSHINNTSSAFEIIINIKTLVVKIARFNRLSNFIPAR